jgi:hypothetical protein
MWKPNSWPKSRWERRLRNLLSQLTATSRRRAYRRADAGMIEGTMRGRGPDSRNPSPESGMRLVYNISSAHIPALLGHGGPNAYKNRYDLEAARLGGGPPPGPSLRKLVDEIISRVAGTADGSTLYYGAVELNGAGIRYFGDVCLVLMPGSVASQTVVLYRNSYDLARSPIRQRILKYGAKFKDAALREAQALAGHWPAQVPAMAASKVLDGGYSGERRLTTAMVSEGVLSDEDYLEVVRVGSFGRDDIEEIRVSAADAGAEARIADRLTRGPTPSLAEMIWRHRRRSAERSAAQRRLTTRVVVTHGRAR